VARNPQIVITCVSFGTISETLHKRLSGCRAVLSAPRLASAPIIGLMPLMTNLGDLLFAVAPATLLAAWIGFGSERISCASWQIGLAFFRGTFQEFGPTLDMETARDRVVGIILIFVIFTTIWPVSAARVVRANLVKGMAHLAARFRTQEGEVAHSAGFTEATGQAHAMVAAPSEAVLTAGGSYRIDAGTLAQVQALLVPIAIILDLRRETPNPVEIAGNQAARAPWFERAAAWTRDGSRADEITKNLPEPPEATEPVRIWHRFLDRDIRAILPEVGPRARAAAHDTGPGRLDLVAS
jgi:multidrug resistance protein MdtO